MSHIAAGGSGEAMQDADVQLVSQEVTSLSLPQLPLPLLAAVKCFHSALVLLQLSDPRCDSLSSRLHLPLRVSRPFTGTPVYALSLTQDEQLRAACGGNTAKLVRLLAEGTCRFVEPDRNAFKKMMHLMLRRVAGRLAAAARERVFDEGLRLQAAGQHAAAAAQLQYAVALGHLPARAALAWLLRHGRQGVPAQCSRAEQLAEEGARAGCAHCKGVLAKFEVFADDARSVQLARESAAAGCKYGQCALGWLHSSGRGGLEQDHAKAFEEFRLAAAQGLEQAQCQLGNMVMFGLGVDVEYAEALRLYGQAAEQGYAEAYCRIAHCYEHGYGVVADRAEALRLYQRSMAGGYKGAEFKLKSMCE